ncbi:uncharacterized protein LOC120449918 [Drosophila santomea]|uniref:uncharacterized protein LOC120449918 n=1 Tax=Drosophila santomea TaxID=129105 RepID=UPI00195371AF|nr:uncharacterized protein LOC120449918 [Drosophila santomea]
MRNTHLEQKKLKKTLGKRSGWWKWQENCHKGATDNSRRGDGEQQDTGHGALQDEDGDEDIGHRTQDTHRTQSQGASEQKVSTCHFLFIFGRQQRKWKTQFH